MINFEWFKTTTECILNDKHCILLFFRKRKTKMPHCCLRHSYLVFTGVSSAINITCTLMALMVQISAYRAYSPFLFDKQQIITYYILFIIQLFISQLFIIQFLRTILQEYLQ